MLEKMMINMERVEKSIRKVKRTREKSSKMRKMLRISFKDKITTDTGNMSDKLMFKI